MICKKCGTEGVTVTVDPEISKTRGRISCSCGCQTEYKDLYVHHDRLLCDDLLVVTESITLTLPRGVLCP